MCGQEWGWDQGWHMPQGGVGSIRQRNHLGAGIAKQHNKSTTISTYSNIFQPTSIRYTCKIHDLGIRSLRHVICAFVVAKSAYQLNERLISVNGTGMETKGESKDSRIASLSKYIALKNANPNYSSTQMIVRAVSRRFCKFDLERPANKESGWKVGVEILDCNVNN